MHHVPLQIRSLVRADRDRIEAGFRHLGDATIEARFLSKVKASPQLFAWIDEPDGRDRAAVGASHADSGAPVGLARYVRDADDPSRAELAVTVVDEWQRRGVGTALLAEIARHAARAGITTFSATAFAENRGARLVAATLGVLRLGPTSEWRSELRGPGPARRLARRRGVARARARGPRER